jgi:hypothetical protein
MLEGSNAHTSRTLGHECGKSRFPAGRTGHMRESASAISPFPPTARLSGHLPFAAFLMGSQQGENDEHPQPSSPFAHAELAGRFPLFCSRREAGMPPSPHPDRARGGHLDDLRPLGQSTRRFHPAGTSADMVMPHQCPPIASKGHSYPQASFCPHGMRAKPVRNSPNCPLLWGFEGTVDQRVVVGHCHRQGRTPCAVYDGHAARRPIPPRQCRPARLGGGEWQRH